MRDGGFTLIEVIAALMLFSVGIVALISMNTQSVRTVNILEDRFVAGVVADNLLVEARRERRLETGEKDGEEQSMGRQFEWQREIIETELDNFFKITVRVREAGQENILMERTAYRLAGSPE